MPKRKDLCDRAGAERLAERIKAHWRARGHEIEVTLHEAGFVTAMRSARVDVRTNLVNAMPPKAVNEKRMGRAA